MAKIKREVKSQPSLPYAEIGTFIAELRKSVKAGCYVGWRKCMRCGRLFWLDGVQRLRLCAWNGVNPGYRTRSDDGGI
ncbi:MAG: hypothetical protein LBV45_02010 [Xanthomonadaceae bacterium]|nr:hypothetical protein [Xanthomonadaceae bacterium]